MVRLKIVSCQVRLCRKIDKMSIMRTVLSIALRENHSVPYSSLGTRFQLPIRSVSYRPFSTLVNKTVCQCGAEIPETRKPINLFRERNLRQITQDL